MESYRPTLMPRKRFRASEARASLSSAAFLPVPPARAPGEQHYRRAQGDHYKQGSAEPDPLRDEPDGRGADEEPEVTGGRDGRDGRPGSRVFRPPRRAERRREDDREPEPRAGEAYQRRSRVRDPKGYTEPRGRDGCPGPHERHRSEAGSDPVSEETSGDHGGREGGESGCGESRSGPERALEVDGAPVGHRALTEQDAERDHPEPGQRPRRPGERWLSAFSSVLVRGQHPQVREGEGCQRQSGDACEVRRHADAPRRDGTADSGSREPAEAERGVEGRHDRTPLPL